MFNDAEGSACVQDVGHGLSTSPRADRKEWHHAEEIYTSKSPPRSLLAGPAGATFNSSTKEFTLHCPDTGLWRLSKDDMDEEIKELKGIIRAEADGTVRVAGVLQEDISKHQRLAIEAMKRAEYAEKSQSDSEAGIAGRDADFKARMAAMTAALAAKEAERAAAERAHEKAVDNENQCRKESLAKQSELEDKMARDALAADRKYYASVENYEGELAALRAALAAEKKARSQEHQMLTTQAMMMKTLNRNLKAQLKALEAKYRSLDQQYKEDSKELHHQIEEAIADIRRTDASAGELRGEVVKLRLHEKQSEKTIDHNERVMEEQAQKIKELEERLASSQTSHNECSVDLAENRGELESFKNLLRETRDQLDAANKNIARKEDAERHADEATAKYDEIRRELRTEKAEHAVVKKELARVAPMEDQLEHNKKRVSELGAELSGKHKECNELDRKITAVEHARQAQRAKLEEVQDAMFKKTNSNIDKDDEIEKLKMQLEQEQTEVIILTKNLGETEDELNKNIDSNNALTKHNEAQSDRIKNLLQDVDEMNHVRDIEKQAEDEKDIDQKAEINRLTTELQETTRELNDTSASLAGKENENEGLKTSLSYVEDTFAKDKAERIDHVRELSSEINGLKEGLYEMTEKQKSTAAQLHSTEGELAGVEATLNHTELQLERERQAHSQTRSSLEEQLGETNEELRQTKANLSASERREAGLEAKCSRQEDKINKTEQQLANEQASHRDDKQKADDKQAKQSAEILELNQDLSRANSESKGLQGVVDSLRDAKGLAETSGEEKEVMIANLTGENSTLHAKLDGARSDIQDLKAHLSRTEDELQSTQEELAQTQRQARKDADDSHDREASLDSKLAVAQDLNEVLARDKAGLQHELEDTIKHDKESMADNNRLQSTLDEEHTKRIQENDKAEREIATRNESIKTLEKDAKSSYAAKTDLERSLEDQRRKLNELAAAKAHEEELARRESSEMKAEIVSLQAALQNRTTKCDFEMEKRAETQNDLEAAEDLKKHAMQKADAAERESKATREELEAKLAMVEGEIAAHSDELKETRIERRGIEQSLRKQTAENMVLHNTLEGRERKVKALQREVSLMTKELQEINSRVDLHDKVSEINTALLGDMQCKAELLKIADMNERQADKTISALKEELIDSRLASEKLKETETELKKAGNQIIALMQTRKAMEERAQALGDEKESLKQEQSKELYEETVKQHKRIDMLQSDKEAATLGYEMVNSHVVSLSAKLEKEQFEKASLYETISKLAKKLGENVALPEVGPGVLHLTLGKVTNLPHLTEHELEISSKSKSGGGQDLNDPYLQFGVKDRKVDSSIKIAAGSRATWDNEVLTLEVPSNDCLLSCKVTDWERFGAHRTLAESWLDLRDLTPGKASSLTVELAPQGSLTFTVEYTPTHH